MNYDENFGFNIKKIQQDIEKGIDPIYLINAFYVENLVQNTAYKANTKEKFGTWRRITIILNDFLSMNGVNIDFSNKPVEFFVNTSVFFTSSVINMRDFQFIYFINKLNYYQLNCLFCKVENVIKLKEILLSGIYVEIKELVFLQYLLASCKEGVLDNDNEKLLINNFLQKENVSNLFRKVLEKRLKGLNSYKSIVVNNSIKILITGQLRGFKESLPTLIEKIKLTSGVDVVGISTWKQIGQPRFIPQLYSRIFEEDALSYYENQNSEYLKSKVTKYIKNHQSIDRHELAKDTKSIIFDTNIFVHDQDLYPFNCMYNAEKMYFHNTFLSDIFLKENDNCIVIKMRPDYLFKDISAFDLDVDLSHTIYTESSYRFEPWGFGIGDQLFIGSSMNMREILNCHNRNSMSYQVVKVMYGHPAGYSGHVNCGLEAWMGAIHVRSAPSSYHPVKICSSTLINLDTLKKIERDAL